MKHHGAIKGWEGLELENWMEKSKGERTVLIIQFLHVTDKQRHIKIFYLWVSEILDALQPYSKKTTTFFLRERTPRTRIK